jgi:zinc protease
VGLSVDEINNWPVAVSKVTAEDVQRVAAKYLDIRRSVTGTLIPVAPTAESDASKPTTAKKS